MKADDSVAMAGASLANEQPVHPARWIARFMRLVLLLTAGVAAYFWSGFSQLVLISFDDSGLEPGEPIISALPIDHAATLARCLGPVGWVVGLGVFGLAFAMALAVYRRPWPLRVMVAVAPPALVAVLIAYVWDLHPWVRPVCLQIAVGEMALAVAAAVLCRPIGRLLLRWVVPKWSRTSFFAAMWRSAEGLASSNES